MLENNKELLQWIDNATPEELLRKWRFGEAGNPIFIGTVGRIYAEAFKKMRAELGDDFLTLSK